MKKNPRLIILMAFTIVLVVAGIVAGIMFELKGSSAEGTPKMTSDSLSYDFGTVSMADGLATHDFMIKNEGQGELKLSNISTSCMCTSAVLEINGEKSPVFGMHGNPVYWSGSIQPGQSAMLKITFDPLAHGPDAIGPVTRTITMYSNDGGNSNTKKIFSFRANVVK